MGNRLSFKRRDRVTASVPAITDPGTYPIASPWSSSDLNRIVAADVFGSSLPDNTRSAAMRIPAIARSRNLLASTISRLPLHVVAGQTVVPTQPSWITSAPDGTSPQLRLAWTVDDLIFYGWSCWYRINDPETGYPLGVHRLNQGSWSINDDNRVEVDGSPVADSDVIVIPGLHEGILSFGSEAIDDTRTLYRNVRARLLNPTPQLDLHQTDGDPLSDTQIDALIDRWAAARQGANGGVGFTSRNLELRELGAGDAQLMIEARNAAAVDMARLVGVTASRVDATGPSASLTYETATGRNQELVDFDLALYMTPISARLSLDDVTEPGQRTDFDLADFVAQTPSVSGPNFTD